ncbi:MAG: glycosyltransferase [Lachnospiraceae bacterium]|nr:glycosyltransferase [Lachnospiraceae bacterium]
MTVLSDLRKTLSYAKRNGLKETLYAAKERLRQRRSLAYSYAEPDEGTIRIQESDYERLAAGESPDAVFRCPCKMLYAPVISILVPAYDPKKEYFDKLVRSVLDQTYGRFELIIVDVGRKKDAEEVARSYEDPRIRYYRLVSNEGISGNTNAAAAYAEGDYVTFLDHDDWLTRDALYEVAQAIMKTGAELVYTDEDKCDETGRIFFEPNIKPDFNLDYLYSNNYICHLLVMKRELFLALKLRPHYDGAQDYDLVLRAPKSEIYHVPKVLYHWRSHSDSTAQNPENKNYAYDAGRRALEEYFAAAGIRVSVEDAKHMGFYRVSYEPDIFTARREVGAVGGRLLDRRHRVVGGMMDIHGNVAYEGMHELESGPQHRADTIQDAPAVDARCMKIRKELYSLYKEVFGFEYKDADPGTVTAFDDPDVIVEKSLQFCSQARQMGYLIVWDPEMTKMVDA